MLWSRQLQLDPVGDPSFEMHEMHGTRACQNDQKTELFAGLPIFDPHTCLFASDTEMWQSQTGYLAATALPSESVHPCTISS